MYIVNLRMVNSKWNVINHETNRRPNCMWSILSWAIFTKVSFGIITVCDDINFLLSTYPSHTQRIHLFFYIYICFLPSSVSGFGYGFTNDITTRNRKSNAIHKERERKHRARDACEGWMKLFSQWKKTRWVKSPFDQPRKLFNLIFSCHRR